MKHFVKILFGFLHYDIPYIAKRTIPNHAKTRFRCIEVMLQNWQIVMNFFTLIIAAHIHYLLAVMASMRSW